MTRPFNLSSTQPAASTNEGAAVTAYVRGIQAALVRELDSYCIQIYKPYLFVFISTMLN